MTILLTAAIVIVLFLLWNHVYNKCVLDCYDCDSQTVAYSIALIALTTGLIYFSQ